MNTKYTGPSVLKNAYKHAKKQEDDNTKSYIETLEESQEKYHLFQNLMHKSFWSIFRKPD